MPNDPDESRVVLDDDDAAQAPEPDDRPSRQRSRERHVESEAVGAPVLGAALEPSEADVIVPWDRLSEDARLGVISEFVTREGTEYGEHDISLDRKIADVQLQIERGEIVLLFDAKSETVNLVRAVALSARGPAGRAGR